MVKKSILIIIFVLCSIAQVIPVIRSGTKIEEGIGFWGPNGHDGVWHLALINQINNPIDIDMPIFSGEKLKNYHPFFDIVIAYVAKITQLPPSILLFQIFPILSTFIYLCLSYKIGQIITKSAKGGIILMILNTLNNSFGWIVNWFRNNSFEGESLFWSMQSPSNQLNPPFILSLVLLLTLIYILISRKSLSNKNLLFISLILIFLPVIKAYSAIPAFVIFFVYIIHSKRYYKTFAFSLLLSIILFLQFNKNSSSLLIWQPFWFVRSLFESIDKLYWPRFALLAQTSGLKLIIFYLIGIPIFLIGNLGFRLLGLKSLLTNHWIFRSLLLSTIILTIIPLFFIQSGTSWNTVQFLYYTIFLLNIPLALYLSKNNIFIAIFVISIQLLPLLASFPQYLGKIPPSYISNFEISCLEFLRSQPKSIILTQPYDSHAKDKLVAPIPLYAYTTTSYVSAYSRHFTYLEDEMNLANSGYDWSSRRHNSEKFFKQENEFQDRGFLLNNKIDFIYLTDNSINLNIDKLYIQSVYQNPDCRVFKVIK